MRQFALEAKTIARLERHRPAVDPELEPTADHHAGLFAGMSVGLLARRGAGRETARQQLQRARQIRAQQFVDDPSRIVEPATARAAHDEIAFLLRHIVRIEKPTDGDAERARDGMQRLDRRRRAIALQQAEIADRQAARLGEAGERDAARLAQATDIAPDQARLARIGRLGWRFGGAQTGWSDYA